MAPRLDGGTAFPVAASRANDGMSLRDYFAGRAMHAWLSTFTQDQHPVSAGNAHQMAETAYAVADAMLDARERL